MTGEVEYTIYIAKIEVGMVQAITDQFRGIANIQYDGLEDDGDAAIRITVPEPHDAAIVEFLEHDSRVRGWERFSETVEISTEW